MSKPQRKVELSAVGEGLVGALVGGLIGVVLWSAGMISPLAILGVAAGVGLGSGVNAWRRARQGRDNRPPGA